MSTVPFNATGVKRDIDQVHNVEYPDPVREISPAAFIINEMKQISQHAIDVMSRYTNVEIYDVSFQV